MTVPRGAYCKVLAYGPIAGAGSAPGNFGLDILAQSRPVHKGVSNLTFWTQGTLSCYTPTPEFHAAHCLLADTQAGKYPVPDTSASPYPTVLWRRVSGTVNAKAVLPDGNPAVHEIKILDSDPNGAAGGLPWEFQTTDLGAWKGDYESAGAGAFGVNRGVAVTVRLGTPDGAQPTLLSALTDVAVIALGQSAADGSSPGDVRVRVGTIWSVLFPAGGDPCFEKKFSYRDADGTPHEWVRLHTFVGAVPEFRTSGVPGFLVTFFIIAERLMVSVGGHSVAAEAFCYYEPDPKNPGANKVLSLASAPVTVTGRAGGGPRWIGIRRLLWGTGRMTNRFTLQDASVAPASFPGTPAGGTFTAIASQPAGGGGAAVTGLMRSPTLLEYTATLTSAPGGREPCALKWILFRSAGSTKGSSGLPVDYGGAVTHYHLHLSEPDFAGAGSIYGSRATCEITFDTYELDKLAAAAGASWQSGLAAYAPASFVTGRDMDDGMGGYTAEEGTRLVGYFEKPELSAGGFNDNKITLTLSDASILLHEPAGFIDPSFQALDFLILGNPAAVYGWQGVQYILGKVINQKVANALVVYLPPDWYPLATLLVTGVGTGQVPSGNTPLFLPPYNGYADEWLKEIQLFDFAALYWAGQVPIYGQFDQIIAGLPVHDAYTAQESSGLPSALPLTQTQVTWIVAKAESNFDTSKDFNHFVLMGRPPGSDDASTQLGVPIVTASATDGLRVSQSWRRTKLFQGTMFFDPLTAGRLVQKAKTLTGGAKAAERYTATSPFVHPILFWGHKLRFHGGQSANLGGKTLRIVDLVEDGNGSSKAETTLKLVEMI